MMRLLWILAAALAAAAAAAGLKNRQALEADPYHPQDEPIPEPADSEEPEPSDVAGEDGESLPPEAVPAQVVASARAMDPVTFAGASRVTFRLPDGSEKRLHIPGDSGTHLIPGDRGMLAFSGDQFIRFEKENGEIVGALFHVPAPEEEAHE